MKQLIISILFLTIIFPLIYSQKIEEYENTPHNIFLNLKIINFIKNKEFSNPKSHGLNFMGYLYQPDLLITPPGNVDSNPNSEGYTLIGNFIQPTLIYYPSDKLRLKFGVHLLNYSGAGKFSQIKPVFSTKLSFSDRTSLTMGTLEGSEKHRLFDPVFDSERLYSENAEDGIQFLTENDHIFNDTWINWENFIFKGDTEREILTFGESFRYTSGRIADLFKINIPFQGQIKHKGGQISDYKENVESHVNLVAGLGIDYDIKNGNYGTIGFEYDYFLYKDISSNKTMPFTKGHSGWYRMHYSFKWLYYEMAYWRSHDFYAPNGNLIYSSVSSVFMDKTIIPDRAILTNSLYVKTYPVKELELYFGVDIYYDYYLKKFFNAAALHFNFEKLIKLATLKQ